VGISVTTGCKPCTDYHVKKVREVGASNSEIKQARRPTRGGSACC